MATEGENKIEPAKAKNELKNPAIVTTYTADMARVLENDTEGLVKKIIKEEEGREKEKKNVSPTSKKNKLFISISIVFWVLALAILSYLLFNEEINTVPVERQFTPLIFNDKTTFLEVFGLEKEEIARTVLNRMKSTEVKIGGIEGVYLMENKQIVGLRRFVSLIKANFAPNHNPLFVSDNFLMGIVNNKTDVAEFTNEGFFILLKIRSMADIFDALRAWEKKMFFDLYGFLGINLSSETNYLLIKNFEDGIVENKNARIIYDNEGGIALMYVFADDNSVVITNSKRAVHEIILRLSSASKKQ